MATLNMRWIPNQTSNNTDIVLSSHEMDSTDVGRVFDVTINVLWPSDHRFMSAHEARGRKQQKKKSTGHNFPRIF